VLDSEHILRLERLEVRAVLTLRLTNSLDSGAWLLFLGSRSSPRTTWLSLRLCSTYRSLVECSCLLTRSSCLSHQCLISSASEKMNFLLSCCSV
jgi:hypothetical protein